MLDLKAETIDAAIKEGKYLLLFYTDWCPLCPPLIEMLKSLEEEEPGRFRFARINFDENKETAKRFDVPTVPVVLAVVDGVVLHGWGGLTKQEAYRTIVRDVLYNADDAAVDFEAMNRLFLEKYYTDTDLKTDNLDSK